MEDDLFDILGIMIYTEGDLESPLKDVVYSTTPNDDEACEIGMKISKPNQGEGQ